MPGLLYQTKIIHQKLDENLYLSEFLFFPEICQMGKKEKNTANLRKLILGYAKNLPALNLYQKQMPLDCEVERFKVSLNKINHSLDPLEEVEMELNGLTWKIDGGGRLCYLPVLGIEVVCSDKDKNFDKLVTKEILHALRRQKAAALYKKLEPLTRVKEIEIEENEMYLNVSSPAEKLSEKKEDPQKQLKQSCTDLDQIGVEKVFQCDAATKMLADLLKSSESPSLILVGPAGVGKTAIFNNLTRRKIFFGVSGKKFYATSGSRLVAGMTGFGQWQERCLKVIEELKKCQGILHLGSAVELLDAGKSTNNSQGIASFLETYINRGDLTCVVECTPEEYSLIEKLQPGFLETFYKVEIKEPEEETLKKILQEYIQLHLFTGKKYEEVIKTSLTLMKRHAPYSAFPGKALRLLDPIIKRAKSREKGKRFFTVGEVYKHFSIQTGLPEFLLNEEKNLNIGDCRNFFEEKVSGQPAAVETVVSILLTVKANLMRPLKPIAAMMFAGPTGVGKTEMAKTLAEYLFNDRNRILRFDMSEYASPQSIMSLTGYGNRDEGLLTSKVRTQPFSVILFDELEKAGPGFFDLLLQILGEGRLTDHKGRTADFCSSVIIMTSNLGASSFQAGSLGFEEKSRSYNDAVEHFNSAVQKFFRPEIYNRIDRIVPFMPLEKDIIRKICRKELKLIEEREGLRYRKVTFNIEDKLVDFLADKGCDPLYGARPLKRTLEQDLVTPLSEVLNKYQHSSYLKITASLANNKVELLVSEIKQTPEKESKDPATLLYGLIGLRRRIALLENSSHQRILTNKISELNYLIAGADNVRERSTYQKEQQDFVDIRDERAKLYDDLVLLEEENLTAFYKSKKLDLNDLQTKLSDWNKITKGIFRKYYCIPFNLINESGLYIKAQRKEDLLNMLKGYLKVAGDEAKVRLHKVTIHEPPKIEKDEDSGEEKEIPWEIEEIPQARNKIAKDELSGLDYFMQLQAPFIQPMLHKENGMTTFQKDSSKNYCWVRVIEPDLKAFMPPEDLKDWNDRRVDTKRRHVDLINFILKDPLAGKNINTHGNIPQAMADVIEVLFDHDTWNLLKEDEGEDDGYF